MTLVFVFTEIKAVLLDNSGLFTAVEIIKVSQRNFFNPIISLIGQYVALLRANYIAHGTTSCPIWEISRQLLERYSGLAI